jgi:hypothetical protein
MDQLFQDERVPNDPWMEGCRLAEDGEVSQEHSSTSKVSRNQFRVGDLGHRQSLRDKN